MRLKITKTNSNTNYYIIKDFKINGKRTTKIIEKLGTENDKDKVVEEITNYHKLDLYTNKDLHDIADKTSREDEINDYLYTKNYEKDDRDFNI